MNNEIFGGLDPDQFGFMAEAEGQDDLVDTREAKLNAIVNDINDFKRANPGVDVMDHIDNIIEDHNIEIESLSPDERSIIDDNL